MSDDRDFYRNEGMRTGPNGEFLIADLLADNAALREQLDNAKAVLKNICDEWSVENGAVCDPTCDGYGHSDTCKATGIAEYLKALREAVKVLGNRIKYALAKDGYGDFVWRMDEIESTLLAGYRVDPNNNPIASAAVRGEEQAC